MKIGIDLDNTIISYDNLLYKLAVENDYLSPDIKRNKKAIRDIIRKLPEGEIKWQKFQAIIYGPKINEAELINGVSDFLKFCKNKHIKVNVISHKTEYANYDTTGTNLRLTALKWMEKHDFFNIDSLGLSKSDIFFESTRKEKIERIIKQRCTHFIDDLEETFCEPAFPNNVKKILFANINSTSISNITACNSWKEIKLNFEKHH